MFLAADDSFKIKNDFGSENEVHCSNHSSYNKSQNLALEQVGRLTVDVPTKFQQPHNLFVLEGAPDASYSRPIAELTKFDVKECMKDIKARLYEKSCFGGKALNTIFKAMDKTGNCALDCDDFRWGLMDYGIQISKEDATELAAFYNHDSHPGCIQWVDFLIALRGDQNSSESRLACVKEVFAALDENKTGSVTLDTIAKKLDPSHLPFVKQGKLTEREAYMELMAQFDS